MTNRIRTILSASLLALVLMISVAGCGRENSRTGTDSGQEPGQTTSRQDPVENTEHFQDTETQIDRTDLAGRTDQATDLTTRTSEAEEGQTDKISSKKIKMDFSWKYAKNSKINSGQAVLYRHAKGKGNGITVCINAGHGTKGGERVKTLCHPDGSPKVTGGTTGEGATSAMAVASGMTFPDGTEEAEATLSLALLVKEDLLDAGYDVLMIRESEDVQLDNVARTVMANNNADCHIALHYDSTRSDKGVFFLSVPDNKRYRNMEPVKSHWKESNGFGRAIVSGIHKEGFSLFSNGEMPLDLTQTSYSTIPSIDLEVGDGGSDISSKTQEKLSRGILRGINQYYRP